MDLDGFIILCCAIGLVVCTVGRWWCDRHVNMKNWR